MLHTHSHCHTHPEFFPPRHIRNRFHLMLHMLAMIHIFMFFMTRLLFNGNKLHATFSARTQFVGNNFRMHWAIVNFVIHNNKSIDTNNVLKQINKILTIFWLGDCKPQQACKIQSKLQLPTKQILPMHCQNLQNYSF